MRASYATLFTGVAALFLSVVMFSTTQVVPPQHTFKNQLLKPCLNMSNCSGEQSSTNCVGFKKSNEPMTVELVCACVGAKEEVDPVEESGIFVMYVQVCSAICVHNSVWLDIVDNDMSDNCLHLSFFPSSAAGSHRVNWR